MRSPRLRLGLGIVAVTGAASIATPATAQTPAWAGAVDAALGRSGAMQPDGVYKFGLPRSDLRVTVGDVRLRPALALGTWLAFLPIGNGRAMAMGDLVLTEDEIGPVMHALQEGGVEPTALHNHLRAESPHVMYMHIMASGDPETIARTIHTALALSGTPLTAPAPAPTVPALVEPDTVAISGALRHRGTINRGVYQISVPRGDIVRAGGHVIPPSMGLATALNFQPNSGGRTVATGDFVLLGSEVNGVMGALRAHGIEVTAVHSHMIDESPRLLFLHFWANGDAETIAEGLRAALDLTNSRR
jgi:hypothetical protein